MLRGTRSMLSASTRGLPKRAPLVAPFSTLPTRTSPPSSTRPSQVPTVKTSSQLVPFTQRSQYASGPIHPKIDKKSEEEIAKKKLESRPGEVTSDSSTIHFLESSPTSPEVTKEREEEVSKGVVRDLHTVKETFALRDVPPLSLRLGLAGTIPYLGTSIATTYLSWALNTEWPSSSAFLRHFQMGHEQAAHYLHLLEPIQLGYGAVILSFLGAVHWGLEYAETKPSEARTRFRYGLGVLAPILAWPTMIMPVQFALISQFAAFTLMYMADARASTKGWAPEWYGTYRFVLTFIVGTSILISLIGREKIGADQPRLTGLREKFHKEGHNVEAEHDWEKLEAEEKAKVKKEEEEAEKKKKAEESKKKKKGGDKKDGDKKDAKKDAKGEANEVESEDDGSEDESDGEDTPEQSEDEGEGGDENKDKGKDEGKGEGKDEESGEGDKEEKTGDDDSKRKGTKGNEKEQKDDKKEKKGGKKEKTK